MKKSERKILGEYLRATADAMELRDWNVVLSREPCDDDTFAQCRCRYGTKRIEVKVPKDFPTATTLEEQRHTLIHELVHAHTDGAWKVVEEDFAGALGREARALLMASYTREIEVGINALASALAKHLPLIDWSAA